MKKNFTLSFLFTIIVFITFFVPNLYAQDNCATANPLLPTNPFGTDTCVTTIIPFSTNGFTFSGDSACSELTPSLSGTDYWYQWVATSNGLVWSSFGPGWPYASIYTNDCGNLTEITGACVFQSVNEPLFGWNVGDTILVQVQDFAVGADVEFCFVEGTTGCSNPVASNYNPAATVNDGSCIIPSQMCETATLLSGCSGSYVSDTIYGNAPGQVATGGGTGLNNGGDAAKWYAFEAPGNGLLVLNNTTPGGSIIGNVVYSATNPEVAIHDLGLGSWTGTIADSALCNNTNDPATLENTAYGLEYSTVIPVTAGNVYLIEWGNEWTESAFDWDWQFGCEAITGVNVSATTETAAQIDFIDTLSDGSTVQPTIEYGLTGFTPGSGTTVSGLNTPIIITGLSAGQQYEYIINYPCNDASGCNSLEVTGTFMTQPDCTTPLISLTGNCIAQGFFSIDIAVVNPTAFESTIVALGNPSGFNLNVNSGPGTTLNYSNVDVVMANTSYSLAGPFSSGTQIGVQLSGIDEPGCPSAFTEIDLDCSCFSLEPSNDDCINALNLQVDTVATCDGISAPFSNICAGIEVGEPDPSVASCFNAGIESTVWFTFQAPVNGDIRISTDYTGGQMDDTEIALYSGTCGALTEVTCDQDGGVGFLSVINATDLVAGDTYFIQFDKWGGSLDGTFCIDVIDVNPPGPVCPQTLNITGLVATGTYNADDVISSNGQINTSSAGPVTYNAGANAGEYIELTNNFDADGTVNFIAENIECDTTD